MRTRKGIKQWASRQGRAFWVLVSAVVVLPLISLAVLSTKAVHDFEGRCLDCHLSLADNKKIFVREIDFLCSDCHRNLGLSHPSGMRPAIAIPEVFPLDWAGRMSCATCHNVHGETKYLLRSDEAGRGFCYQCHKGTIGKHGGSNQPAHSRSRIDVRGYEMTATGGSIDRLSIDCISCHDSILGSGASATVGSGIWNHGNGVSHPIGVSYSKAFNRGGYNHQSKLNPNLRFFDGKIGCGTCHNIYSKERYNLAMSNDRSGLCLACHRK